MLAANADNLNMSTRYMNTSEIVSLVTELTVFVELYNSDVTLSYHRMSKYSVPRVSH